MPQPLDESDRVEEIVGQILLAEEQGHPLSSAQIDGLLEGEATEVADEVREFLNNHRAMKMPITQHNDGATALEPPTLDGPPVPLSSSNAAAWSPNDSSVIRHFDLVEELGRGGMGVVYRGRDRRLGQDVAVKLLASVGNHDPLAVQRFYIEAQTAAQLSHPGIVSVFEVGEDQGRHYYAMALVEGETLSQKLAANGPLSAQEAAELVRVAALAVQYAHDQGVIHRDLKPSNLMIDSRGIAKIMDFGLAKRPSDEMDLTMTGQILGTLSFMSPEQASGRNKEVGTLADVYSLGAVLYAALTGRPPFEGESHAELLVKVLTAEPNPPKLPRAASDLAKICMRCLEKKAENRYQSAGELADDLNAFLHGEPIKAVVDWQHHIRKWIRRQPSLAAHLMAISTAEIVRHSKEFFGDHNPRDLTISLTLGLWAAACVVTQMLVNRFGDSARYAWPLVDLVFLTGVLSMLENPHGSLVATYPLVIVFCGLLFRVRLIAIATGGAIIAYLWLLALRASPDPPHYQVMMVLLIVLTGIVVGTHVRRLRLLDEVYQRRQGG